MLIAENERYEKENLKEELFSRTCEHIISRDIPSLLYLKDKV